MIIDIPTTSFCVYKDGSKFSKKQKRWLLRLAMLLLGILMIGLSLLISRLFPNIGATRKENVLPGIFILIVIMVVGELMGRKIMGKLIPHGTLEFNAQAIVLTGDYNKIIGYDELIYLSTQFERPENHYTKHPPAKAYMVDFMLASGEKISIIASRLSLPQHGEVDIYDLLSVIRKQNHHLYKALKGIKKYSYE